MRILSCTLCFSLLHIIILVCMLSTNATAQTTYFTFTDYTGNNATVVVPADINPTIDDQDIQPGDEVGVFTPGGLCVGAGVWSGNSLAIAVWGDDDQTTAVDGIQPNEKMYFRFWQKITNKEFRNVLVKYVDTDHYRSDGIYAMNGMYLLDSLRTDDSISGISDRYRDGVPQSYELYQNYPNPFNPTTVIRFALPEAVQTRLDVYTITGQLVLTLIDEFLHAGYHEVVLRTDGMASGVYYYRIAAGGFSDSRTLVFVR
jgi:hypothetical protein